MDIPVGSTVKEAAENLMTINIAGALRRRLDDLTVRTLGDSEPRIVKMSPPEKFQSINRPPLPSEIK